MVGAHIVVEKLKARQFFNSNHLPKLRAAVQQHHYVTSYATLLLKAFYLHDIYPLWHACLDRSIALPAALQIVFDADLIQDAFTIVRGKPIQTRARRKDDSNQKIGGDALSINDPSRLDDETRPSTSRQPDEGNDHQEDDAAKKAKKKTKKSRAQRKRDKRREQSTDDEEQAKAVARRWWRAVLKHRWKKTFMPNTPNESGRDAAPGLHPKDSISMSHSLAYAAEQLAASYETNIVEHYPEYVGRIVRESLARIPEIEFAKDQATKAVDDVLLYRTGQDARCRVPEYNEWIERNRRFLIPDRSDTFLDLTEHLSSKPWDFLPYMVRINLMLEDLPQVPERRQHRLFSPLIVRKSFVPGHMTIDTTALAHLLFEDKCDIQAFKDFYMAVHGVELVNLTNKASLAASYASLTGRANVSKEEEAQHAQRIWEYVCHLDPSKDKHAARVLRQERPSTSDKPFRFGRMVRTDGYNVSVLMTTAVDTLGRKRAARKRTEEMPWLNEKTPVDVRQQVLTRIQSGDAVLTACDPGKGNIATFRDNQGRTLIYTKARRDRECRFKKTSERTANSSSCRVLKGLTLRWIDPTTGQDVEMISPTVSDVCTKYLSRFTAKTCDANSFDAYIKARAEVERQLRPFYESAFFRHQKYSVYLAKKASEDRLIDRIRNKFGGAASRDNRQQAIFIAWGNWGKRPNAIKGTGSTPGIGLRRKVHQRLAVDRRFGVQLNGGTMTTFEGMTSSCCNSCGELVSQFVDERGAQHYRVLECAACRIRWNRDVLGATNILACAQSLLEHGHRPAYLCRASER